MRCKINKDFIEKVFTSKTSHLQFAAMAAERKSEWGIRVWLITPLSDTQSLSFKTPRTTLYMRERNLIMCNFVKCEANKKTSRGWRWNLYVCEISWWKVSGNWFSCSAAKEVKALLKMKIILVEVEDKITRTWLICWTPI